MNLDKPLVVDPFKAAKTLAYTLFNTLATKPEIIKALDMQDADSVDEEFWDGAFRTVRSRFSSMCLSELGYDMAREWKSLNLADLTAIAEVAKTKLSQEDFSYSHIRNWFIYKGRFEVTQAIKLRRERKSLEELCVRVLLLLEEGGAKYLAYDTAGNPVLVRNPADAYKFPVTSVSQTTKEHCLIMADNFNALAPLFNAREIKVLVGLKAKSLKEKEPKVFSTEELA